MGEVAVVGEAAGSCSPATSAATGSSLGPFSPPEVRIGSTDKTDHKPDDIEASGRSENNDEWEISESMTAKTYEADKFGFWQATAMNTLNMFGTGPFITVPFLFAATIPAGPQVGSIPIDTGTNSLNTDQYLEIVITESYTQVER